MTTHPTPTVYTVGPIVIDLAHEIVLRQQQPVELTAMEWSLLRCLLTHPNHLLSPVQIADYTGIEMSEAAIRTYISRLRQKLEPDPGRQQLIRTVHGRGYRLLMAQHEAAL